MSARMSVLDACEGDAVAPVTRHAYLFAGQVSDVLNRRVFVGDAHVHEQVSVLLVGNAVGTSVNGHVPVGFAHARTLSGVTR